MYLQIHNFQDISNLELYCERGNIFHITGDSGCGKSAIFEAIYWCLYGSVKGVDKRGEENRLLSVLCDFSDCMKIFRQRNPKRLEVTCGEKIYEGTLAQQKIMQILGCDENGWVSMSYVTQGDIHPLLKLKPKERYHVLLKLSMDGEDAEPYNKKIMEKIRNLHESFEAGTKEYEKRLALYEKNIEKFDVSVEDILSEEKKKALSEELSDIEEQIPLLEKELRRSRDIESKVSVLTQSLLGLEKKKSTLSDISQSGYDNLKERKKLWEIFNVLNTEKKKLQELLESTKQTPLPENLSSYPETVTQEKIREVEIAERNYKNYSNIASKYDIAYEKSAIDEEMSRCNRLIENQENAKIAELARLKISERNKLYTSLPAEPFLSPEEAQLQVEIFTKEITELKKSKETHLKTIQEKYERKRENKLASVKQQFEQRKQNTQHTVEKRISEMTIDYVSKREALSLKLKEAAKTVENGEKSKEIHRCPHCGGGLRYVANRPEKSTENPFDANLHINAKETHASLKGELSLLESNHEKNRSRLEKDLSTLLKTISLEETEEEQKIKKYISSKEKTSREEIEKKTKENIAQTQIKLSTSREICEMWEIRNKKQKAIEKYDKEIELLPDVLESSSPVLGEKELANIKKKLQELSSLVIVEKPPFSAISLEKIRQYEKKRMLRKDYTEQLSEVQEKIENVTQGLVIEKVKDEDIISYAKKLEQKHTLDDQARGYQSQLDSIEEHEPSTSLQKKLTKYKSRKSKILSLCKKSKQAVLVVKEYEELEVLAKECNNLHQKEINFQRLLQIAQEAMVESMREIIDSVNSYLRDVSHRLFPEAISIQLSTEKSLKSGQKRQQINLEINYKGGIVHNFFKLSGGERARISTLLTVAFARYCDSKILILDETISYLDDIRAMDLVDLLKDKKYGVSDRIILLASQNCSSGLSDKTVPYLDLLQN